MLHPATELRKINDQVGYGIFATQSIPQGTITWALDPLDQIFDITKTEQLDHQCRGLLIRYSWINGQGQRILCWDFGGLLNHSCEATSYAAGGCQFEIAVRDIAADEELTNDYATLNLEEPLVCQCGSSRCRGIITLEHLEDIAPNCDALIRSAFTRIHEVQQPLWHWIESQKNEIDRMVHHPDSIPSVLTHRWPPAKATCTSKGMET